MKRVFNLFLIFVILGSTFFLQTAAVKDNEDDQKIKEMPEFKITGYEENTLLIGLKEELNSVESIEVLEAIIEKYTKLSNVDISRLIKAEKIIKKIENGQIKNEKKLLKDKDYKNLDKWEQKIYSKYKIKIKPKKADLYELEKELKNDEDIKFVQRNYFYQINMEVNDPAYVNGNLWGIIETNTNSAWDTTTGENIIVATVDTGLDYNHPDILNNLWINPEGYCGYDFSDNDNDPMDYEDHGTHVAGIIAAEANNNLGTVGVSPNVKIMSVKVFPNATSSVLAEGLKYAADYGADIINNSWGPKFRRPDDALVNDAIEYAYNMGSTIIFSAGNSNDDAAYYFGANHPNTICVTSVDELLEKAPSANYGEIIDISAPGMNIYSLQPGGTYQNMSGTSMATPHVAGLAALIKSVNPDLTNDTIRQMITEYSTTLNEPLFYNAGFMNSLASIEGSVVEDPNPPIITDIPSVYIGQVICINGSNFINGISKVIITGNGINRYANIHDINDTQIFVQNEYDIGTYQMKVENNTTLSNPGELIVSDPTPPLTPSLGLVLDAEIEQEITILGKQFQQDRISVHISGNGYDENAVITFACPTAVKIENLYDPGVYTITVYNDTASSNQKSLTIYDLGEIPEPNYNIVTGNNPYFNWIVGTYYADELTGHGFINYITGYEGNDRIIAGTGNDVFVIGEGHGYDIIEGSNTNDMVQLIGIDPNMVTPTVDGDDYILYIPNGMIRIKDQFVDPQSGIGFICFW